MIGSVGCKWSATLDGDVELMALPLAECPSRHPLTRMAAR